MFFLLSLLVMYLFSITWQLKKLFNVFWAVIFRKGKKTILCCKCFILSAEHFFFPSALIENIWFICKRFSNTYFGIIHNNLSDCLRLEKVPYNKIKFLKFWKIDNSVTLLIQYQMCCKAFLVIQYKLYSNILRTNTKKKKKKNKIYIRYVLFEQCHSIKMFKMVG